MKREAKARWTGGIKDGRGNLSTDSGALSSTPYSFKDRFEDGQDTNPEELLAAAHAGCFSMALAGQLGKAGMTPASIETTARVSLEPEGDGFAISEVHLEVTMNIPGADRDAAMAAAEQAKQGCPVSKLFNAKITMDASLES
ncbi:MAG: OsmC family protein [Gemmatimonadota bacterium]